MSSGPPLKKLKQSLLSSFTAGKQKKTSQTVSGKSYCDVIINSNNSLHWLYIVYTYDYHTGLTPDAPETHWT